MAPRIWSAVLILAAASVGPTAAQQFALDNRLSDGDQFSCHGRSGGYYANRRLDCSSYHMCGPSGLMVDFACPPGTRFHQQFLVCDHVYRVDCSRSERYFDLNDLFGWTTLSPEPILPQKRAAFEPAQPQTQSPARVAPQQSGVHLRAADTPSPASSEKPRSDAARTLLELVRLSGRQTERRPPEHRTRADASSPSVRPQPAASAGSQRRVRFGAAGRQVTGRPSAPAPPAVPSGLLQIAALDRTAATVAPPVPTGHTRATFFSPDANVSAARRHPRIGAGLVQLSKSLAKGRGDLNGSTSGDKGAARVQSFTRRKGVARQPAPSRFTRVKSVTRRKGVARQPTSSGFGWTPAARRGTARDPRCPRCLAALVISWNSCFPCVFPLR